MSCARRVASTSVSIQRMAPGIAPAGTSRAIDSRSASVTPASTSAPASTHASATPRPSSHSPTASSHRLRPSASKIGAGRCRSDSARVPSARSDGPSSPIAHRSAARSASPPSRVSSASAWRRTAAAGLLSSCARPAASVPSAVNFSRCWIERVESRTRSVIVATSRWPSTGMRASISPNRSLWILSIRRGPPEAARPTPLYFTMRENGSSPVTSPGVLHEGRHQLSADAEHQVQRPFEDHEHRVGGSPA